VKTIIAQSPEKEKNKIEWKEESASLYRTVSLGASFQEGRKYSHRGK